MGIRDITQMLRDWWNDEDEQDETEEQEQLPEGWKKKPDPQAAGAPAAQGAQPDPQPGPHVIKVPKDHPLMRLYDLRREEKGSLPTPHICMDENQVLPGDLAKKEAARLRQTLTGASLSRLNKARPRKDNPPPDLDAEPWFYLSSDKLAAWMLIFPPAGQGQEISQEAIRRALKSKGIVYGVDEVLVNRLSYRPDKYCTLHVVA